MYIFFSVDFRTSEGGKGEERKANTQKKRECSGNVQAECLAGEKSGSKTQKKCPVGMSLGTGKGREKDGERETEKLFCCLAAIHKPYQLHALSWPAGKKFLNTCPGNMLCGMKASAILPENLN